MSSRQHSSSSAPPARPAGGSPPGCGCAARRCAPPRVQRDPVRLVRPRRLGRRPAGCHRRLHRAARRARPGARVRGAGRGRRRAAPGPALRARRRHLGRLHVRAATCASAEDAVRGSALEWTVLRPNNFDQNFDEELWHAPLLAGELALPAGEVPEPFIDLEDVADVAAAVLTEPGRHAGRIYELTGPRAITFAEAVELISRASGSADHLQADLRRRVRRGAGRRRRGRGRRPPRRRDVRADGARPASPRRPTASPTVLGRAPRTFEDYVVRTAAAGAWRR